MYNTACVVNLHLHPGHTLYTQSCTGTQSSMGTESAVGTNSAVGTESDMGTCCGILLDTERGLVLAHASCLGPFVEQGLLDLTSPTLTLKKGQHWSCEVLLQKEGEGGKVGRGGERVSQVPVSTFPDMDNSALYPDILRGNDGDVVGDMKNLPKVNVQTFSRFPASIMHFFQCPHVKESLQTLMPAPAWELLDRKPDSNNNDISKSKSQTNVQGEVDQQTLLSSFIILQLQKWRPYKSSLHIRATKDCHVGESVEICSTPFAGLKPDAFINSYSRGIVSNLAGKDNCLLLTDARCILGGEGAPLYTFQPHVSASARCLTGVVLASLCWKNEEWVGFCVACDVGAVIKSAPTILQHVFQGHCPRSLSSSIDGSALQGISCPEVVLLKVGPTWGSGVVVDGNTGTILTCSHVIKEAHLYPVEAQREGVVGVEKTKVVYRQRPLRHQFDLAVVQAEQSSHAASSNPVSIAVPVKGMEVFVVGHALFGPEHHLPPSVTSGVISKVISMNKVPVMIQTTCAVHPGASGGALVDTRGRLLAIVICNVRDNSTGASFPHVNMSIPVCTVWSYVKRYLHTRDVKHLERLTVKNSVLDTIWALGSTHHIGMAPKASKL